MRQLRQFYYEEFRERLTVSLDTPAGLAAGVGLPEFMLCLLFAFGSVTVCLLEPPATILDGLPFDIVPFAFPFMRVGGFGVGWSMMRAIADGRRNMPRPARQLKYRCPCTDPSFLPLSSSSSTPIQSPAANCVLPAY